MSGFVGHFLCLISLNFWLLLITSFDNSIEQTCGVNMDKQCLINYYKDLYLPRRDPVKHGHITRFSLENGQIYEMKTLSLKPPIFEIPNFLNPEECDEIIKIAEETGLETSSTMDEGLMEDEKYFKDDQDSIFDHYDINKDAAMDIDEIIRLLDSELDFTPDKEDVLVMFKEASLDSDGDMLINKTEFQKKDVRSLIGFVARNKREKPYTKSRNSNQTWLETDINSSQLFHSLRIRLQKLTELPMMLINASESLQVVSYGPRGHYNCHLDSDDIDIEEPCCHLDGFESSRCRICRYLTVLYFLNDVEEGGETAFPVADNETFDEELWHKDENRICNVGRNCYKSNLRVKPEKGKAILWYTHLVDEETGWLGESDPYSFHGGCDVVKGTKWIANSWISVSEDRTKDIELWLQKQEIWRNPSRDHDNFVTTETDEDDEIFKAVKQEIGESDETIDSLFDAASESLDEDHDSRIEFDQNQRNEL